MRIMNDIQTPQSKTKTALSRWLGLALALFLAAGCSSEARDITAFYSNNCAACHGINLQGGTAPSLLTNVWTQGADDVSIARAISEGNPTKGMPAWKEALTAAEIRAMVVLLREKIAKPCRTSRHRKPNYRAPRRQRCKAIH